MTAAKILDRLDAVRQTGDNRWIARCPAHEDRSPSLAVRELPDGRILLHDFGGCPAADVLAAIGLKFSDLFPEPLKNPNRESGNFPRENRPFSAEDALRLISREALICALAASDSAAGKPLSETDAQRAADAAGRIFEALDIVECRS